MSSHSSHSSSHSSLLQMNRPDSLLPQLPTSNEVAQQQAQAQWLEQHEHTQQQLCRSKGSASDLCLQASQQDAMTHLSTSSHSRASSSPTQMHKIQPVASSSSGLNYLNVEPVTSPSVDFAVADVASPLSDSSDNRQMCAEILATAQTGVIGEVIDRSKWQPDADSALCTYPLCTANFAQPTYFFLGPRRHHCRMCGQLFCSSHSSQRGSLVTTDVGGKRRVVKERVCDLCCSRRNPEDIELPKSAQQSRRNSSCTESASDDHNSELVTPYDEEGNVLLSGSVLLRAQSRITLITSNLDQQAELAPIEDWMDRSGVLSLYPLAVNPSHSKSSGSRNRNRSTSPAVPSAGPLFSPSISMRRQEKEKQLERLTLRQRRMGSNNTQNTTMDEFWLPGKWGYKREDFDPTFLSSGEVVDEDEEIEKYVGGIVEDGPIRFRTGVKRVITPLTTPNGGPNSSRY
ncbi:uncharacterized protein I206_100543 [Kwoniella pini CBS 10737]|uniref:FYVE-type domain-containing protein n=1 Tax=Kwoniella pini CBS 10737 TaxID=1296096 RepID=A0A1B9ICV1_9TREE|nr:uncharacterized protein I206_00783 [Kwoniella pini CBS 10737]OCF53478.1 hypothetical protein I206_00783 [Kwoniella pini CBS 10737]